MCMVGELTEKSTAYRSSKLVFNVIDESPYILGLIYFFLSEVLDGSHVVDDLLGSLLLSQVIGNGGFSRLLIAAF